MRRLFAAPHNVCFWHKADIAFGLLSRSGTTLIH